MRTIVLRALENHDFRATEGAVINVRRIIRQEVSDAARMLAVRRDLDRAEESLVLHRALSQELIHTRARCFLLLSFIYDPKTIRRAQDSLSKDSSEQTAYAIEALDTTISRDLRAILLPLFEERNPTNWLSALETHFPQKKERGDHRLSEVIGRKSGITPWIRACAIHSARSIKGQAAVTEIRSSVSDSSPIVRETAAAALFYLDSGSFEKVREILGADPCAWVRRSIEKLSSWKEGDRPMLMTIEKVMVLKSVSIFSGVPDEILGDLATAMEEVEVPGGQAVYEKGPMGQWMYIVADGQVKIHDGDRTFVTLNERDFFGELTTLDPEPQSASATALEDTRLLGVDRESLYELMTNHPAVLRGFIHILCSRLRAKLEGAGW